jgi:hypothetical protein
MLIIRLKPTFKKNPAAGKVVSYARIYIKAQFHPKKSMLTIKPAFVIWKVIVCANGQQFVVLKLKPIHN